VSDTPVRRLRPGLTPAQQAQLLELRHHIARWVKHFTKKYRDLLEPDDVAQIVNLASSEGVRTWRRECNVPVEFYAWKHVNGEVIDAARKQVAHRDLVRAAAAKCMNNQRDDGNLMKDTEEMIVLQAQSLSDRVLAAMAFSLVAESTVRDATAGEDEPADRDMRTKVRSIVAKANLLERELTILEGHYPKDREIKEIAEEMEIGYSSARRIHNEALTTLAERFRANGFTGSGGVNPRAAADHSAPR
jgi:RNA polymerase sigma factor (sigma-70 family)